VRVFRFSPALLVLLSLSSASPAAAAWNPFCIFTRTCGEQPAPIVKSEDEQRLDIEFEIVFGPAPVVTKPERRTWDQNRKLFGGLVEIPKGATKADVDFAAGFYRSYHVPAPLFYLLKGDERALFRDGPARYGTSAENAVHSLFITTAGFQIASIRAGVCVPIPHALVPGYLLEGNEKACQKK